ncbi:hypothetical protein [Streptomyces nitrosporeus]|uniref:hypothetical protein n=1 Tax=Streptomyces nitrosporeus TaxID=28894 RepID=UPI001E40EC82|nr:hypothetical protein [Streptomyces nitrosporeus]
MRRHTVDTPVAPSTAGGPDPARDVLAGITGDGRTDTVGSGGPGVYAAQNLCRHVRTR